LKPDGIVVLTTPDVAAVRPDIAKSALNATLSIGLHLILHSGASLEGALRAAGFAHIRLESDGWKLTAFAAGVPLDLCHDPAERHAIVTRYLCGRAEARSEPDDLFIGFAGRAFFEDVDAIEAPPARIAEIPFDAIGAVMPFNLAVIMLARAYQRLNGGEARSRLRSRFIAIRTVCGPLWMRLEALNLGDMQTRQILWVAHAEELLCLAAACDASTVAMMGRLPQSPTGAGRSEIVGRAIEILIHGEHPFTAARLARAEGVASMRRPGDLSAMSMINAFLREWAYRARRRLRAR
jgi:hypothetical protein